MYQASVPLPERLLELAHLPRTGTADTAVLCLARDHARLRARIALMPEHMSKLDVLRARSKRASCAVKPPASCWTGRNYGKVGSGMDLEHGRSGVGISYWAAVPLRGILVLG